MQVTNFRLGSVCAVLLALAASTASADYVTGSEDIRDRQVSGDFSWRYSYTRSFDGEQVMKHVEINFVFSGFSDTFDTDAYRAQAEANIEAVWNNKFKVRSDTGDEFPVVIDVTTTGPFNQTVTVFNNTRNTTDRIYSMTKWYALSDTRSLQAHEFGHMIGLFDEYAGGAVDDPAILSSDGLMGLGALSTNPVMYARYYQQFADFMTELNASGPDVHTFTLVPVPLPPSLALMGGPLGVMLCWRIVGRKQRS